MFGYLSCLALSFTTTVSNERSQYTSLDRVWGTSKHHRKVSLRTSWVKVIRDRKVKRSQAENFLLAWLSTCFWVSCLSKLRKASLEHYLDGLNRTIFVNKENTEFSGNSVKSDYLFSKYQRNATLHDVYLKLCARIHCSVLSFMLGFSTNVEKLFNIFFKFIPLFSWSFSHFSKS